MMHLRSLRISVPLLFVFLTSSVIAAGPSVINLKEAFNVEGQEDAVIFPHHRHQRNVSCSSCHPEPVFRGKLNVQIEKKTGFMNDFHRKVCWPCHEKMNVRGGKSCGTCHNESSVKPSVVQKAVVPVKPAERAAQVSVAQIPSESVKVPVTESASAAEKAALSEAHSVVKHDSYPYFPSLLKWDKTEADFNDPQTCAQCHQDKYEEWSGSMHSLAFKDPMYQGELNAAVSAIGHGNGRQCEGCHTPAAVVKGEIKGAGFKGLSPLAMSGVSCDVCHSVSGHTHWETPYHQPGNGSLILSPGKDAPGGPVLTKYGPLKTENGGGAGFHECVESPLHLSSELCASCHQIYHYKTNTPLESTYTEWKNGPYSANDIQCQDCHMVANETFKRSADTFKKPDRNEYRHYFNGANFLLYYLNELAAKKAGDKKLAENAHHKYEMAVSRLQSAAAVEIVPVYDKGRLAEIKVRVKNIRAGHNLPTSLSTIRQMWLELSVKDEQGVVLLTSGTIDGKGSLPENARIFNSEGQDNHFKPAIDPWKITSFAKHNTIPPRGYLDVYYGVPSPVVSTGSTGTLTIEAKLRYRQADQEVAEKLLGLVPDDINLEEIYGIKEIPPLPIIDMVKNSTVINRHRP